MLRGLVRILEWLGERKHGCATAFGAFVGTIVVLISSIAFPWIGVVVAVALLLLRMDSRLPLAIVETSTLVFGVVHGGLSVMRSLAATAPLTGGLANTPPGGRGLADGGPSPPAQ